MEYAFEWVIQNGGIDTESDYPYQPVDGNCDTAKEKKHVATFTKYYDVQRNSVSQLLAAVSERPVSVGIEADREAFQLYSGGVLDKSDCGTSLDHGVLVVGFTAVDDKDLPNAWIVKNSWGSRWGDKGYIYISRTTQYSQKGICGILQQPSYITGGSVGPNPPGPTPPPAGSDQYENPNIYECQDGERAVKLTDGRVCAPMCKTDADCPGAPTGFEASPSCSITDELTGQKYCALSCVYSMPDACGGSDSDSSHAGAQCKYACQMDNGQWYCRNVCMYAKSEDSTADRINQLQRQEPLQASS